jgi:subtilisin family serine protease
VRTKRFWFGCFLALSVAATSWTASAAALPLPAAASPAPASVGVLAKPRAASGSGGRMSVMGAQQTPDAPPVALQAPAGSTAEEYAADLMATGAYEYAEPNYIRTVNAYTSTPSDPDFSDVTWWYFSGRGVAKAKSWFLKGTASPNFNLVWPELAMDGAAYHARATAAQVPIAVIDTGFYLAHPDKGDIIGRKDCLQAYSSRTGRTTDLDVTPVAANAPLNTENTAAHGTNVASLIAQASDNGIGNPGAGYDAKVYVYKVQGTWTEGNPAGGYPAGCAVILDEAVIDAIRTAADDGCRVISISLGGPSPSAAMQSAIDYAWTKGAVVVASAGNTGSEGLNYPGGANHVLGIGATFSTNTGDPVRSSFSSYGTGLDLMAPGEGIWGPTRPGYDADGTGIGALPGYSWWSGTSMATPLVSAAAATVLRLVPDLSPDEVEGVLASTATNMGTGSYNTVTGWGLINVRAAANRLAATYPLLVRPRLSGVTQGTDYPADTALTLSWSTVSGYGVSYVVRGDWSATPLYSGAGTSVGISSVPDGAHRITVTPSSKRNWTDSTSVVSVDFSVNQGAPAQTSLLSLSASAEGVAQGETVSLSGSLSAGGAPLAGQPVAIWTSADGRVWTPLTTVTTATDGTWSYAFAQDHTARYRASFAGDPAGLSAVSGEVTILLVGQTPAPAAAAASSITIRTSATTSAIGKTPVLSGRVTPGASIGTNVVVYVRKPGRAYYSYSSNRTVYSLSGGAAWQYKYYFKRGMPKGVYSFKAVVSGSATLAGSESSVVTVRLK